MTRPVPEGKMRFLQVFCIALMMFLAQLCGARAKDCAWGTKVTISGNIKGINRYPPDPFYYIELVEDSNRECGITTIYLPSAPPPSCVKGGTVTASGTFALEEGDYPLEDVTEIHCQ